MAHVVNSTRAWLATAIGVVGVLAACGGGGGAATTPTVVPMGSATSAAPAPSPSPAPTEGLPAASVGRSDCPPGWLAYPDPAFTVCFPQENAAQLKDIPGFSNAVLVIQLTPGPASSTTPDIMSIRTAPSYAPPTTCTFESAQGEPSGETGIAPYSIGDAAGMACTAHSAQSQAVEFRGEVPWASGGLEFRVYASNQTLLQLSQQILGTLRTP